MVNFAQPSERACRNPSEVAGGGTSDAITSRVIRIPRSRMHSLSRADGRSQTSRVVAQDGARVDGRGRRAASIESLLVLALIFRVGIRVSGRRMARLSRGPLRCPCRQTLPPSLPPMRGSRCSSGSTGTPSASRARPECPNACRRLLTRSAVGAGSLADLGTDYAIMVSGFSASLRTKSIFFRLLDDNAVVRAPAANATRFDHGPTVRLVRPWLKAPACRCRGSCSTRIPCSRFARRPP